MLKDKFAELIGWHMGDGCLSIKNGKYQYALTGDIKEEYVFYKDVILPTFNELFSKKINLKKYLSNNVCGIYIFDKESVRFLKEKFKLKKGKKINITIPETIKLKSQKKAFLRGLFDTDGSIYYCKSNYKTKKISLSTIFHYKPKIKLATISKTLIDQVHHFLSELGFHPRFRKPAKQKINENMMYGLVLYRKQDVNRFIKEIGFKNLKHISKVKIWNKFGFCPPYTTLKQRIDMLKGKLSPLVFYPEYSNLSLEKVKKELPN